DLMRLARRAEEPSANATVHQLLSQGADPNACCLPTEPGQGCPVLHATADINNNAIVATALLEAGAEVGATCRENWTALHIASGSNAEKVGLVLLNFGASVSDRTNLEETPLHWAADRGNLGTLRLLIDFGADVDAGKHDGFTPLHLAAFRGFASVAELLVERGADILVTNNDGKTPGEIICKDALGCQEPTREALTNLLL
ncbi:unnamed protein product, partial [Ostreobium quekettii]